MTISIEQAQLQLAELIEKSSNGEEIVITRDGNAVAEIVPRQPVEKQRKAGFLKGKIHFIGPDDDSHLVDFKEYME